MLNAKIVPEIVKRAAPLTVSPDASVQDAIDLMIERGIGCVLVTENTLLVGIFTERDVLTRIAGKTRPPAEIPLRAVMTERPDTLLPDDHAIEALNKMRTKRYRHLPVVENGVPVAVVSIRDLHEAITAQLEEEVKERDAMLFGSAHGLA